MVMSVESVGSSRPAYLLRRAGSDRCRSPISEINCLPGGGAVGAQAVARDHQPKRQAKLAA